MYVVYPSGRIRCPTLKDKTIESSLEKSGPNALLSSFSYLEITFILRPTDNLGHWYEAHLLVQVLVQGAKDSVK